MAIPSHKKIYLPLLVILVSIAALFVGYKFSKWQPADSLQESLFPEKDEATLQREKDEKAYKKYINKADYIISAENKGYLVKTIPITLQYLPNSWARSIVTPDIAEKLRMNLDAILYDKQNIVMPLGGKLRVIRPTDDGQYELAISLPLDTKTEFLSTDSRLIVTDAMNISRYPISALKKDINENYYVWTVKPTDDKGKYTTEKIWLGRPFIGDDYFAFGDASLMNKTIIIEPDDKIKNNKTYDMALVQFDAPLKNPIKEAYKDYKDYMLNDKFDEMRKKADECRKGLTTIDPNNPVNKPSTSSCGAGPLPGPNEIFQTILNKQAIPKPQ